MQATLKSYDDFAMLRLRLASKRAEESAFEQVELTQSPMFEFPLSPYNKTILAQLLACLNAPALQTMPITLEKARKILPLPALYLALRQEKSVKLLVLNAQAVATLLRLVLGVSGRVSQAITAFEAAVLESYLQSLLQVDSDNLVLSTDFNLVLGLDLPQDLQLHFNAQLLCLEAREASFNVVVAQKEFSSTALKIGAKLDFGQVDLTHATLISPFLSPEPAILQVQADEIYITRTKEG